MTWYYYDDSIMLWYYCYENDMIMRRSWFDHDMIMIIAMIWKCWAVICCAMMPYSMSIRYGRQWYDSFDILWDEQLIDMNIVIVNIKPLYYLYTHECVVHTAKHRLHDLTVFSLRSGQCRRANSHGRHVASRKTLLTINVSPTWRITLRQVRGLLRGLLPSFTN